VTTAAAVRAALRDRQEIAILDLRHEADYARGHPLFAACMPLGLVEVQAWERLPRRDVPIVVYGYDARKVERGMRRLRAIGFDDVSELEGGLSGWTEAGGELFIDVNSPSKAFGELVAHERDTPFIAADELERRLREGSDVRVFDVRPAGEYAAMRVPGAMNVPGCEIVQGIEPRVDTESTVVVNCAGRTRGIIAAQSLVDLGLAHPVAALRNGTIGWKLAGLALDTSSVDAAPRVDATSVDAVDGLAAAARALARRAGVQFETHADTDRDGSRTVYRFDVRSASEYEQGHRPDFRHAPGGQLVQETDVFAPVRGARIVLAGDATGRAELTGSWLAQMGWDVVVVDPAETGGNVARGPWVSPMPPRPAVTTVDADAAATLLAAGAHALDLAPVAGHAAGHVPGARFVRPDEVPDVAAALEPAPDRARPLLLTSTDGVVAAFAAAELATTTAIPVVVIEGGTATWRAAGQPLDTGTRGALSPLVDDYRRPYVGPDVDPPTMQAYLDWEFGLVRQLERDGTHGFRVLPGASGTF
jgi:rhodanese-related sulfurtransferase